MTVQSDPQVSSDLGDLEDSSRKESSGLSGVCHGSGANIGDVSHFEGSGQCLANSSPESRSS